MAGNRKRRTVREVAGGGWALLFFLAFAAMGIALFVAGLSNVTWGYDKVELSARCETGESGACIRRELGIVQEAGDSWIRVAYDDARRSSRVDLKGDSWPPVGAKVFLERWDGDVISILDRETENRYRTILWPERWSDDSITMLALGFMYTAIFVILPVAASLVLLFRRASSAT